MTPDLPVSRPDSAARPMVAGAAVANGLVIPNLLANRPIPSLDGLRALAVLWVVFYHFGLQGVNGGLGVEVFFTLSGFLITWLLLQEIEATGTIAIGAFYRRRSLRIMPAMFVYLLFGLAVLLVRGHPVPWDDVLASALYVQNYYDGLFKDQSPNGYLAHTWSLAVEEQFYLLWPILLLRLRNNLALAARVLGFLIVAVWIYRATMILGDFASQRYLYRAFESCADQLAVGCLLAVQLKRGALPQLWSALTRWSWLPLLTLALLVGSSMLHDSDLYRFTVGFALEAVLSAVLIVQLIAFSAGGPWSVFNRWPLNAIGRLSYSLYLYHPLVLFTARRLTAELPLIVQLVFALAVALLFAWCSYAFIERRFRAAPASGGK